LLPVDFLYPPALILKQLGFALIVGAELFAEKRWKTQIALALIIIPLILRIVGVK